MSTRNTISTTNAPNPVGPYVQAVIHGDIVYCSGQLGIDPATGALVSPDAAEQTRQCMANLQAVLEAAGSSLDQILRTTIYITDITDFPRVNIAYGELLTAPFPARATVEVSALALGAVVEIDAIASRAD
jgi:2-iminobutanoate/2-iminopropanoate deaminase